MIGSIPRRLAHSAPMHSTPSALSDTATRRLSQTASHLKRGPEAAYKAMKQAADITSVNPESSVLITESNCTRTYHLNRPKQLNAINQEMVRAVVKKVDVWSSSRLSKIVIGRGKGGKAFCAGGDIKHIAELTSTGNNLDKWKAMAFFKDEFELDWKLASFSVGSHAWDGSKAYVALMDGLTMGGGAGLSFGAVVRVATEKTKFAMPETLIGYTPDVGATHYLSLLDGKIGRYLALTGTTVSGRACFDLGLATHYVRSHNIPALADRLDAMEDLDQNGGVDGLVSIVEDFEMSVTEDDGEAGTALVGDVRVALDEAFGEESVQGIVGRLRTLVEREGKVGDWAKETIEMMEDRSPVSLMVTLTGMQKAEEEIASVARELRMEPARYHNVPPNKALRLALEREYKTVESFVYESSPDFPSGVVQKLVEKSKPTWDRTTDPSSLTSTFFPSPSTPFKDPNTPALDLSHPTHGFDNFPYRTYGLPSEAEIEAIVKGDVTGFSPRRQHKKSGDLALDTSMVLEWFNLGRFGVKERVLEILERKTNKVGKGEWLAWRE